MTIVANYFNYFLSCQHLHEPPITKNDFLLNEQQFNCLEAANKISQEFIFV